MNDGWNVGRKLENDAVSRDAVSSSAGAWRSKWHSNKTESLSQSTEDTRIIVSNLLSAQRSMPDRVLTCIGCDLKQGTVSAVASDVVVPVDLGE